MSRPGGRVCGIENCRSRRFHVGPDGHTYCSNGHQAEDQLTQIDENAYSGRGGARITRRRSDEILETTRVYQGLKATELGLQCFQLILRKQVYWLVHTLGYPEQLETIVHDLWCLRAQMLRAIMNSSAQDASSEQLFSTQSDTDNSDTVDTDNFSKTAFIERKFPKLAESLSLIYVALLLMKIPVCSGDVSDWVNEEGFVYLQASNIIPNSMKQKLAPQWQMVFTSQGDLNYHQYHGFHVTTMNLVAAFQREIGMMAPTVNYHLLLSRFVIGLSLPVELIRVVGRLARLIKTNFEFPPAKQRFRKLSNFPEVRIMSLIIVAVKLVYPFDNLHRDPLTTHEPSALAIDWSKWQEIREKSKETLEEHLKNKGKELFNTTEEQVFKMSDSQIDVYLDWFGRTWIEDDDKEREQETDFQRAMKQIFPLQANNGQAGSTIRTHGETHEREDLTSELAVLKSIQTAMKPNKAVSEAEARDSPMGVIRPGERYLNYRLVDDLPESAKPLFTLAAEMVGLSLSSMVTAVNQTERKIHHWNKRALGA